MADNDQNNDEYKFAELDSLDNMGDSGTDPDNTGSDHRNSGNKNILRNALIVIGIVIFAMLMYKFIGSMFFSRESKPIVTKPSIPPVTQITPAQPVQVTPVAPISVQPIQPVVAIESQDITKKVNAMEVSQQSVRDEMNSMSSQVGSISGNISALNNQISSLNQIIEKLSNQVAQQSNEIQILMARSRPKVVKTVTRRVTVQRITYYIQAVIPGRAWLIGSNGSTITVREGTKIAGYGTVKLIDSMQGRVLTSSGQVIKFSQTDS